MGITDSTSRYLDDVLSRDKLAAVDLVSLLEQQLRTLEGVRFLQWVLRARVGGEEVEENGVTFGVLMSITLMYGVNA